MKIFRRILPLLILILIILYSSLYVFKNSKKGALWMNGVKQNEIVMAIPTGAYFEHYLYDKGENELGIITLRTEKKFGLFNTYSKYYEYIDAEIDENHNVLVIARYPSVKNGSIISSTVIGGHVSEKYEHQIELEIGIEHKSIPLLDDHKKYFLADIGQVGYTQIKLIVN